MRVAKWLLLAFSLTCLPSHPHAQTYDVVAQQVEFRNGAVRGVLKNNTSHRVRDVELRIRYFWVWKVQHRQRGPAPELSFVYKVQREILPGGSVPFSYATPPLPSRGDGYYDIDVRVARSVNVDSLASQATGAGAGPELKTGRDVASVVGIENLTITGSAVSGVLRNRAQHPIRDVELLIRHIWMPKNEYRPGQQDLGRSTYHTVIGEIQPGGSAPFTYDASPLPDRADGRFETRVAVAGFVEMASVPEGRERDGLVRRAPASSVGRPVSPSVSRPTSRASTPAVSQPLQSTTRAAPDTYGPRIQLLRPRKGENIAIGTVAFEAKLEDESGIANVDVWLNENKLPAGNEARGQNELILQRAIPVGEMGINCFTVSARDVRGNGSKERICLVTRREAVRRPAPAAVRSAPVAVETQPVPAAAAPAPVAPKAAAVPKNASGISMAEKIEILKRHYLAKEITAQQFDRAVRTLEAGKADRMLEDFISGQISVSTFRLAF